MATPKLDKAVSALGTRMADESHSIFGKTFLIQYITRAIDTLFTQVVAETKGQAIQDLFPELLKVKAGLKIETSIISLTDISSDCYRIMSGTTSKNELIRIWDAGIYSKVKSEKKPFHYPTKDKPAIFNIDDKMYILPTDYKGTFELVYLVNPTANKLGERDNDIPLSDKWTVKIVDLAEQLLRKDLQQEA
jgi:hypothetical protein